MGIAGTGVDIVETSRIAQALEKFGAKFASKIFTDAETKYCSSHEDSLQHYAGRFAVKEAVMKVLGTGWGRGVGWIDIEVVNAKSGAPELNLSGGAAKVAAEKGITKWHVSLSHSGGIAVANVIAEKKD